MSAIKKQRLLPFKPVEKTQTNVENLFRRSTFEPPRVKRTWDQTKAAMLKSRIIADSNYNWEPIFSENLNVRYAKIYSKPVADDFLVKLESQVEYLSPELSRVQIFGKWHDIPRKQAAYGDDGLTYKFSGNTVAAKPWKCSPVVEELKNMAESITGEFFNFVLVNRYKDGTDYMGEHKDDEKDLVVDSSIASFSFGESRDFVFRHKDNRGKNAKRPDIPTVKQNLETGSLLIMGSPTNQFWYHSLPVRKNAPGVRVNLTFRRMVKRKCSIVNIYDEA